MATPRLRMFAGPNGSGKSTIKAAVPEKLFGFYLNPDEIEKKVKDMGYLDIGDMKMHTSKQEVVNFFNDHPLIERTEHGDCICDIAYIEKRFIDFGNVGFDSYMSAILTDFLRKKFLANDQSFTFETVMSSPDKVEVLKKAQALGYKTYLYYVATKDPTINLLRINHRVKMGGHNVSEEKVISRYYRSLDLLSAAIKYTNRAFIFDNSGEESTWLAEITNGTSIQFQVDEIPIWFQKYILDKI